MEAPISVTGATGFGAGAAVGTARRRPGGRSRPSPATPHERLRIALLAPVWFPVPPSRYGGIESVVDLLASALVEARHEVTVFASGDSTTDAPLSWTYPRALSERLGEPVPELRQALACYERAGEFDVINDHTGLLAVAAEGLVSTPVLHTVHLPLDGELGDAYEQVARLSNRLMLAAISESQRRSRPGLPWLAICRNAVDASRFAWGPGRGGYLAFVGRMGPEKGCHHAVAAAEECGLPLKIAAKCRDPQERAYFREYIEPRLGQRIEYLGEIGHDEKVDLLRDARALLFPVEWEEPFGLVMLESLACGTPVVAMRRGAVPEVLEQGRTGIIVDRPDELAAAVAAAGSLDRADCRRAVEERFSPRSLAAAYLAAFRAARGVSFKR